MSHSPESIDALIREGTSLKNKIGMIARNLEQEAYHRTESHAPVPGNQDPAPGFADNHISFITPMPGGVERTITDIFSLVCNSHGVDHGGIYIFNRRQRQLNMVCHYHLPDEYLARAIKFPHDSWQVNTVFEGPDDVIDIQRIPLHVRIPYEQLGIQTIALIPLIHHGQVVGSMNLASQKAVFVSGFEKLIIEGLALRISRTVALHLAQVELTEAHEELAALMLKLKARIQLVIRPSAPEPLTGFFTGITEEIDRLHKAISMATAMIMRKLKLGQRERALPFHQKKVEALLTDIDLVVQIIGRLRVFCNSQSATLERGILQHKNPGDAAFENSMVDFYHALKVLVRDDNKQVPANEAFIARQFKPFNRPVKLKDLKFSIDRLTPN